MPEAIILAGGLGTRLKSIAPDVPKCMALVAGKPFIDHVIDYALKQGVNKFVFAAGYLHQILEDHLTDKWPHLHYYITIEDTPLGTGGAIGLACTKVNSTHFLVLNGDTLFKMDYQKLLDVHLKNNAFVTLALKQMFDFERYGTVEIDPNQKITAFNEKKRCKTGYINGGVYLINKRKFTDLNRQSNYSFEKDILENQVTTGNLYAEIFEDYFIDIGIPEDFRKANIDLLNDRK
ncbi:MAG: nucleotidyltransferase family protein [Saprospiraceae bacterium]|nr:nucleotidyltransferase family protein [Saprospiraceae bacterium]